MWGSSTQSWEKKCNTLLTFSPYSRQSPKCDRKTLSVRINVWVFPPGWLVHPSGNDYSYCLLELFASIAVSFCSAFAQPCWHSLVCSLHFFVIGVCCTAWAWISLCPWRISPASLWRDAEISYIFMLLSSPAGRSLTITVRILFVFKILIWSLVPGALKEFDKY